MLFNSVIFIVLFLPMALAGWFLLQKLENPALGGSRRGKARQCLNLLAVFLVSGIWHGANWTFVVWGLMHGLAAVFETAFPKLRFRWEWMNRLATAVFVTLSFSVFRSDSLEMGTFVEKAVCGARRRHVDGDLQCAGLSRK